MFPVDAADLLIQWLVPVNRRLLPTELQIPRLPLWARIANPAQQKQIRPNRRMPPGDRSHSALTWIFFGLTSSALGTTTSRSPSR